MTAIIKTYSIEYTQGKEITEKTPLEYLKDSILNIPKSYTVLEKNGFGIYNVFGVSLDLRNSENELRTYGTKERLHEFKSELEEISKIIKLIEIKNGR
tara:strand:- start:2034 stop:2327 length:294 start_codon:yes stop_codon:yes gene_type:complete